MSILNLTSLNTWIIPITMAIMTKIEIQMIATVDVHFRESIVGMHNRGKNKKSPSINDTNY